MQSYNYAVRSERVVSSVAPAPAPASPSPLLYTQDFRGTVALIRLFEPPLLSAAQLHALVLDMDTDMDTDHLHPAPHTFPLTFLCPAAAAATSTSAGKKETHQHGQGQRQGIVGTLSVAITPTTPISSSSIIIIGSPPVLIPLRLGDALLSVTLTVADIKSARERDDDDDDGRVLGALSEFTSDRKVLTSS